MSQPVPSVGAPEDPETAVYLASLRFQMVTVEHLSDLGMSATQVRASLDELVRRKVMQQITDTDWQAAPPEVALTAWATRLEERARELRSSTPALARIYAEAQSSQLQTPTFTTPLHSMAALDSAVQQVIAEANSTVHMMLCKSGYMRMLLETTPERNGRQLVNGRGMPVHTRAVFAGELLSDDRLHAILGRRSEVGDELRFTRSVPFLAIANDNGRAVLDLEASASGQLGLAITRPETADAIVRTISLVRQLGVIWRPGTALPSATDTFSTRDQEVLRLLAAGASDSTVARQLGVSQRTVERRVRIILDRLNAANRFQAGVLAERRGLL